jgi:CBS domain-containing protein
MQRDVVSVRPDTDVESFRHNRLPVVDEDGRLVGLLTRVDVFDALTR